MLFKSFACVKTSYYALVT